MTAVRAGWSQRHDDAKDRAWAAWRQAGVEPYRVGMFGTETPAVLREAAGSMIDAVVAIAPTILDEFEELDDAARRWIMAEAATDMLRHVPFALNKCIADVLAMTEPVPFSPPRAGAWIRVRCVSQTSPSWSGMWHVFGGDLRTGDPRTSDMTGKSLCGVRLTLRGTSIFNGTAIWDYVEAAARPGVDACRRCDKRQASPA